MARSASARVEPMRVSCSMRRNSSDSGPGTAVQVRSSACSKPRPASTEITSRSRMSGSLPRDLLLPVLDLAVEEHVGIAGTTRPSSTTTPTRSACPWNSSISDEREPDDHRHEAEELHDQDLVDVEVRRVAREHQLVRDLLAVARRREPLATPVRPSSSGATTRSLDRRQHLLVADVLDLVALEPAQRVADVGLLGRRSTPTTYISAPTAAASTRAIINGVMSDLDRQDLAEPEEADEGHDRRHAMTAMMPIVSWNSTPM